MKKLYIIKRNERRIPLKPLTMQELDKRLKGIGCGVNEAFERGYTFEAIYPGSN